MAMAGYIPGFRSANFSVGLVLLVCCGLISAQENGNHARTAATSPAEWRFPQIFEKNLGQAPADFGYVYRGTGFTAGFSQSGVTLAMEGESRVLRIQWSGQSPDSAPTGEDSFAPKIHYLGIGADRHLPDVPAFSRIRYRGLYPGIDLAYYSNGQHLEYDLIVSPGTDPTVAEFTVEGADRLEIDANGDLVMVAGHLRMLQRAPHTYQDLGSARASVESRYRLLAGNRVRIETGDYDTAIPLTIDPVLEYAAYFGGSGNDTVASVHRSQDGSIYLSGSRESPRLPGDDLFGHLLDNGARTSFLAKLSPGLDSVSFISYFAIPAVSQRSEPQIHVAPDGTIYATYVTDIRNFQLPTTIAPYGNPVPVPGNWKTVVIGVQPDGSAFRFYTAIGCSQSFIARAVLAENDGLTIAADTQCSSFPVSEGAFQHLGDGSSLLPKVRLVRLAPDGASMPYSAVIGSAGYTSVTSMFRDREGRLILAGGTSVAGFPTTEGAYSRTGGGEHDGYILRLSADGSALDTSTLLGGANNASTQLVREAPDGSLLAYIRGAGADFPITGGAYQVPGGSHTDRLAKLSENLGSLLWATNFPGAGTVVDAKVEASGEVTILAFASSIFESFPVTEPALLKGAGTGQEAYLARLSADAAQLRSGTRFYGSQGYVARILHSDADTVSLMTGRFFPSSAPPSTGPNLTVDQSAPAHGIYFARLNLKESVSCDVQLSPAERHIAGNVTNVFVDIEVAQPCPWIAEVLGPGAPHPVQPRNGFGPRRVDIGLPRNSSSVYPQTYTVRVDDKQAQIIQSPSSCEWQAATPSAIHLPSEGGLVQVSYDIPFECLWSYHPPASWLRVTTADGSPVPRHSQSALQLRLSADPNSFEARSTSLRIGSVTIPVEQDGGSCTANVSPLSLDLPAGGGAVSIQISTTGTNCAWNAIPSAGVQIAGSGSGTGSGTLALNLPPNPANVPLLETVFVAGKTVELRQQAGQCEFSLSTQSLSLSAGVDRFEIHIQAEGPACAWRPSASEPWITFDNFGGSFSGSGILYGTVMENGTGEARTATISLLGKTIPVTQHAVPTARVEVYAIGWDSAFQINGETYFGNQQFSVPVGTELTFSSAPEFLPMGDGRIRLNLGWDGSGMRVRTYTVTVSNLTVFLQSADYSRFAITLQGNVPGDGSRVEVTPTENRYDAADGPYYPTGSSLWVQAHDGSLSEFRHWTGALENQAANRTAHLSLVGPSSAAAVYGPKAEAPLLRHFPDRGNLEYRTAQEVLHGSMGVYAVNESLPVTFVLLPATCPGIPVPFTASLPSTTTPATLILDLDVAAAALVEPGRYECVVPLKPLGVQGGELLVPVGVTIGQIIVPETAVHVAAAVEAAAFRRIPVPAGGIASIFGERLASAVESANALPLPLELAGTRVHLYHAESQTLSEAPLFYVSPSQINLLVPDGHPIGISELRVARSGFTTGIFPVRVVRHQPSIFSANSDGRGAPAGQYVRVNPQTGEQVIRDLFQCAGQPTVCSPAKVDFGTANEKVYLILYATGIPPMQIEHPVIEIGPYSGVLSYGGPQGSFVGLDQLNIELPRSLAGTGLQPIEIIYSSGNANTLEGLF